MEEFTTYRQIKQSYGLDWVTRTGHNARGRQWDSKRVRSAEFLSGPSIWDGNLQGVAGQAISLHHEPYILVLRKEPAGVYQKNSIVGVIMDVPLAPGPTKKKKKKKEKNKNKKKKMF